MFGLHPITLYDKNLFQQAAALEAKCRLPCRFETSGEAAQLRVTSDFLDGQSQHRYRCWQGCTVIIASGVEASDTHADRS